MIEIEVKVKLENLTAVQNRLENLGSTFSEPLHQIDDVYVKDPERFMESWQGKLVTRIRRQNSRLLFTTKKHRDNPLDCEEFESEIQSYEDVDMVLVSLGFKRIVTVKKVRRSCFFSQFNFCLDVVEGLGSFLEIEYLSDDSRARYSQADLIEFLESKLELRSAEVILEGYDILLYRQLHVPEILPPNFGSQGRSSSQSD